MVLFIEDWKDRLRPEIIFTSPDGEAFTAFWRSSDHTIEKKLGLFVYPRVIGTVVQDLGATSDRFNIPFAISGAQHDETAFRFIKACRQDGQWQISHPFEGFKGLQHISITKLDRTVEQGNVTNFESEWIGPIDETSLQTAAELVGLTLTDLALLNIGAALQFANNIVDNTIAAISAVQNAVNKVKVISQTILGPLAQFNATIANAHESIISGIETTLQESVLQPLALAGQVQALLQLPLKSITNIGQRLDVYSKLADDLINLAPAGTTSLDKNTVAVQELSLVATIGANSEIVVTGPQVPTVPVTSGLSTRAQAVFTAQRIQSKFVLMSDSLDLVQKQFEDNDIDFQYFSQTDTYNDARKVTGTSSQFLLTTAFDLSVERRFTLDRPKTPLQVTIEEYGGLGDGDSNLDLFIDSNSLKNNEILLLPAGKEIVVYV